MNWNAIFSAVLVLSAVGGASAVMLVIASRFMSVPGDERADAILGILPGANCGACGYAGCADYAAAVAAGAPNNLCIPGGSATAAAAAGIMGERAGEVAARVSVVRCRGYCDTASDKYAYTGVQKCAAAAALYKGELACAYGCLGFGDCAAVCKFDAMHIINGVAESDFDFCNGCGACVSACPKGLIELLPLGKKSVVFCGSGSKGAATRKVCGNGCIGCGLCKKACAYDAIQIINNLAVVDNQKCVGCEACAPVCPTGAIGILYRSEELSMAAVRASMEADEEWTDNL